MTTMRRVLRGFGTMTCVVGAFAALAACTGDDDQVTSTTRKDASADGTTIGEAGGDANGMTATQAICAKYGADKVSGVVTSLLANVKADCRIGVYFTELPDQGAHFSSCLNLQLKTFFGCPGASYGADAKDTSGKQCRNMSDAHKGLGIREADFRAFTDDTIAALNANGITDTSDVQSILATLGTTDTAVVGNNKGLYDARCTCDGGSYMGKACTAEAGVDSGTDSGADTGTDAGQDTGTDASDAASDAPDGG